MNKVYIIVCSDKLNGKKKHHLHLDNNDNKKLKNTWMIIKTTECHLEFITWWLAILYKQFTFKQCHNDSQSNKATNSTSKQIVNAWWAEKKILPSNSYDFKRFGNMHHTRMKAWTLFILIPWVNTSTQKILPTPLNPVRLEKLVS